MSFKTTLQLLTSELCLSGAEWDIASPQKLLRFPQKFEVLVIGSGFRILIRNNAQEKSISPKLPGS